MSEAADIVARTQRFNDAARTFTPPSPSRHAKLMPLKDGIVELRQKGASLRFMREPLATARTAAAKLSRWCGHHHDAVPNGGYPSS